MNELFNIEPTLSPRLKWMRRHFLTVTFHPDAEESKRYMVRHGLEPCATGTTENDALVEAAKKLKIMSWKEDAL